jgi:hypothetical protein
MKLSHTGTEDRVKVQVAEQPLSAHFRYQTPKLPEMQISQATWTSSYFRHTSSIPNKVDAEINCVRNMAKAIPPSLNLLPNRNSFHFQNLASQSGDAQNRDFMQVQAKWWCVASSKMEWPDSVIRARTRGDTGARQPHGYSSVLIFSNLQESGEDGGGGLLRLDKGRKKMLGQQKMTDSHATLRGRI